MLEEFRMEPSETMSIVRETVPRVLLKVRGSTVMVTTAGVTPPRGSTLTPAGIFLNTKSVFCPLESDMTNCCTARRRSQKLPRKTRSGTLGTTLR